MSTTVNIDLLDLSQCLARLASVCLYMEAKGQSSINIKRGVWRLTETNPEVDAMWKEAEKQAKQHHTTGALSIQAMERELDGKRIINNQPQEP